MTPSNLKRDLRTYLKRDLNKSHLTGSLLLSVAALLTSCSNTTPLNKNNRTIAATQVTSEKSVTSMTAVKPAAVVVDWEKVEALADKKYRDEPLPNYHINTSAESRQDPTASFYSREFGVSIEEAQRRLLLQGISSPLIEAIAEYLGGAVAAIYYDNHDPNEYALKVTTLNTVQAVPSKYVYHFKQKGFDNYAFPIHIQANSDKTQEQILALQEKATPEIFKRYPNTQSIGFSPMSNTITVSIYSKTMSESERKQIETELTELVGHSVTVEILRSPITVL